MNLETVKGESNGGFCCCANVCERRTASRWYRFRCSSDDVVERITAPAYASGSNLKMEISFITFPRFCDKPQTQIVCCWASDKKKTKIFLKNPMFIGPCIILIVE